MPDPPQKSSLLKTVAIISKPERPELSEVLPKLEKWLEAHGCAVVMDQESAAYFQASEVMARAELGVRAPGVALVLGGDGTLLSAARAVSSAAGLISLNS